MDKERFTLSCIFILIMTTTFSSLIPILFKLFIFYCNLFSFSFLMVLGGVQIIFLIFMILVYNNKKE